MNAETFLADDSLYYYSHRWWIVVTIMMVAILEILDSTIVNVALPSMMSSLGADQNQITWVLTSYVVASAIILPLTGFIANRIGQKHLLMMNITGFMVSSFLCGLAQSLPEMVLFRIFQGMCGASLIPLSQAILRKTFPLEQQGKAMAIWGMGIMVAPICGPTLGGLITEHTSWRWIFYINIPFCIIGLFLTLWVIPQSQKIVQKIDWLGLAAMVLGITTLQLFLDKGNENGWFDSNFILTLLLISALSLSYFVFRSLTQDRPAVKLKLYKDRNFALSCAILMLYCGITFGTITLQPLMLETLFHYPAITAGLTMAPLGIASACSMSIVSQLMTRINVKLILATCVLISAYGAFRLSSITLNNTMGNFLWDNAILGLGMGGFMVPLATYSLASIPKLDITEASGLFSYSRMLGTSLGISLLSTLVTRVAQVNWHNLGSHITTFSAPLHSWLASQQLDLHNPIAIGRLDYLLQQQANFIGFLDGYKTIAIGFLILIPLICTLKTIPLKPGKE